MADVGCSHKMSDGSGVEKETMAQEEAGLLVAEWPLSNSPARRSTVGNRSQCIDEAHLRCELHAPRSRHMISSAPDRRPQVGETAKA